VDTAGVGRSRGITATLVDDNCSSHTTGCHEQINTVPLFFVLKSLTMSPRLLAGTVLLILPKVNSFPKLWRVNLMVAPGATLTVKVAVVTEGLIKTRLMSDNR